MSTLRRNISYNAALRELIDITSRGRYTGPYRGMMHLQPLEIWRGPRIGSRHHEDVCSRLRFVVGYSEPGKPQVVTVLPVVNEP